MSFGWSVSDIALLVQLAYKTSQGARAACGQYDELTRETSSLHVVLNRLEAGAAKPGNPINKDRSHGKELGVIANGCKDVLTQLDKVLVKYNALSEQERSVRRLWKKIKFGNGVVADVAALRSKITYYTSSLTLFLNMISLGTIGDVEEKMDKAGGDLQDIKNAVNQITAHFMATAGEEGSVLTAHTNDDRDAWRELRRRLLKDGFQDSLVRKHMDIIMAYVKELGDRGVFDNINIDEAGESGTMPKPHREASPAMESDIEGNADDQASPGPGETPQQRELHERDEQNTRYMSNVENEPIDFHESRDVCWKLSKLYGYQFNHGHRYEMFKFGLHDLTIYEVDPSVSAPVEAFQFRYMSINSSGVSPVTEDFRGEAHRILDLMYDAFDANTKHFLRSMKGSQMLHAMCKVFSVDVIRATDARQSSIRILKDMKNWTEQFDLESQCRACVNARWRRFSAVTYGDWGGTEYMEALYGYPQIEDIETLRSWHDTYERHQAKASILLWDVYQRYRSFRYPSSNARPESNLLANYELPAFIAAPTVIYKMDEVRAISDSYSIHSSENPLLQEVRLLGIIEKQPVGHKPLNINTIPGEPGLTVYWTPNGLAVSAINLMLHHQDVDQSLDFGEITTSCRQIAGDVLYTFVRLEQTSPEVDVATLDLSWGYPLDIYFFETAELRSRWADGPVIRIHRFPNNTTA